MYSDAHKLSIVLTPVVMPPFPGWHQRVRGRAVLVLDTTHCRPDCVFPARSEAVRFALAAFKAETFNPATLFLVGTHILGRSAGIFL